MAELLPNWLQENCYPAQYDRLLMQNLVSVEGVADVQDGSLLVTTGGTGLELDVAQGGGFVEGDDDDRGMYSIYNDAPVTLTATTADPTNPRIDQVIARVYDTTYGEGADEWVLEMLDGTATGGATLTNLNGATALPDNAIRLAYVLVPATFAGPFVNATHIRDARVGYQPGASMATGTLARVRRGAAWTIQSALTLVPFDTVDFGNAALVNTGTGVYTAPSTGFYRVSGNIGNVGASAVVVRVRVATVEQSSVLGANAPANGQTHFIATVFATAGQAIDVVASTGGGATTGGGTGIFTIATFERIG